MFDIGFNDQGFALQDILPYTSAYSLGSLSNPWLGMFTNGLKIVAGAAFGNGAGKNINQVTLAAGTKVVTNADVTASTLLFFTRKTLGASGTVGNLSYTVTPGTGYTINSSSGTDTSVLNVLLIEAL